MKVNVFRKVTIQKNLRLKCVSDKYHYQDQMSCSLYGSCQSLSPVCWLAEP